jgi:hypothetical protein
MGRRRYERVRAFVLYGCSRHHLRRNRRCTLRLSHGGVLDSIDDFDNIAGRDVWFAGSAIVNGQSLGPPPGIRSVAANSNGTILFANVNVGGIPRSMDGGRTSQPTIDINSDVHEVRAHHTDPDIVVAASAIGLCISRDSRATWTIERDGLHDRTALR